jgi:hypothetical protein
LHFVFTSVIVELAKLEKLNLLMINLIHKDTFNPCQILPSLAKTLQVQGLARIKGVFFMQKNSDPLQAAILVMSTGVLNKPTPIIPYIAYTQPINNLKTEWGLNVCARYTEKANN